MDHTKSTNQLSDERYLIWTRRLSFSVPLTKDDPEDPKEAYAKAMADGRVGKAAPDDSGVEDLDIEVFGKKLDPIEETALLVSRIKHEHRKSKKLHRTVAGNMKCPICGKALGWKIDGFTWRSNGACLTPDCINWRE